MGHRPPDHRLGLANGLLTALVCAIALGALSTLGDWIWARFLTDGAVIPGLVHGLVVFLAFAVLLGWAAGTPAALRRLLIGLPPAGLLVAAAFYPVAAAVGYLGALLLCWTAMWLALAFLQRWARGDGESTSRAAVRGLAAAVLSGLAFWSISGIWTGGAATGYPLRFLYWSWAFLPGFVALLWRRV